jgi:opacity protein-like surface antigen
MGSKALTLAVVVLVLILAGCAAEQGGAGSTSADETTAQIAQEETTASLGGGALKRPPDSTLSYGGREVKGRLGSYCWSYRGTDGYFDVALMPVSPKQQTLTVPSGSEMVSRYGGQWSPDRMKASAFTLNKKLYPVWSSRRSLKVHGSGVERTIPAEAPPGEYVMDVFVLEPQGDANYSFHVMVE